MAVSVIAQRDVYRYGSRNRFTRNDLMLSKCDFEDEILSLENNSDSLREITCTSKTTRNSLVCCILEIIKYRNIQGNYKKMYAV